MLVVDTTSEAPIFHQNGLMIALATTARVAISVKSRLTKKSFDDTLTNLASLQTVCPSEEHYLWTGGFFFDIDPEEIKNPSLPITWLAAHADSSLAALGIAARSFPSLLVTADDLVYRSFPDRDDDSSPPQAFQLCAYNASGLATAFLVADVLDHLARLRTGRPSEMSLFAMQSQVSQISAPVTVRRATGGKP